MSAAMVAAAGAGVALAAAVAQGEGMSLTRARDEKDLAAGSAPRAGSASGTAPGRPFQRDPTTLPPGVAAGLLVRAAPIMVAVCVGLVLIGFVPGLGLGTVVALIGEYRSRRKRRVLRRQRERAAPSLARALADALRGGASVRSALAEAALDRSVAAGLRHELDALAAGMRLGAPVEATVRALAERGGPGLRLLCGTVVMHLEAGGALAGELDRIAADGEAALRIDEDRVAATAQARATVRVVAALPVLALGGAEVASSHFLETIASSPIALALLLLGFVLEALAIIAARAIVGPA